MTNTIRNILQDLEQVEPYISMLMRSFIFESKRPAPF
jgi:hypothetical protein